MPHGACSEGHPLGKTTVTVVYYMLTAYGNVVGSPTVVRFGFDGARDEPITADSRQKIASVRHAGRCDRRTQIVAEVCIGGNSANGRSIRIPKHEGANGQPERARGDYLVPGAVAGCGMPLPIGRFRPGISPASAKVILHSGKASCSFFRPARLHEATARWARTWSS